MKKFALLPPAIDPIYRMVRFICLLSGLIVFSTCTSKKQSGSKHLPLLPYPHELTLLEGNFHPSKPITLKSSGISEISDPVMFSQLGQSFDEAYGILVVSTEEGIPDIWIGLPEADESFKTMCENESIWPSEKIGDEGYVLKISRNRILLASHSNQGLFYGVQTLRQLLRETHKKKGIPAMVITDWPDIAIRAIMDDISRGPIPSNAYIKDQIRRYSELKINQMSFYIEHVVRTEKHPGFAPEDGALSIDEIRELSEYASMYHVKLIGSFQSLGHFDKILSVPEFRYLGATDGMLDPLNPKAMDFLRDVYREMTPVFSSDWFTPNCDEAWDLSRAKLIGEAADLGVSRIYADHVKRIDTTLSELGKRTLIWGDIILEFPGILELLPSQILIGAWNYDSLESFAEFIDPIKNAGFDFTVSPGVLNSNRLFPNYRQSLINIRNFIMEGYEKGTSGVYCTIWDDGGPHFFNHDWYGVAYAAEQCWRPNMDAEKEFNERFSQAFYGDDRNSVPQAIRELNKLTELEPTYEMNELIFSKILIPETGKSISYNLSDWTEVNDIASSAKQMLSKGNATRYREDIASLEFVCHQYQFLAESRIALFKAAEFYRAALSISDEDPRKTLTNLNAARDLLFTQASSFNKLYEEFIKLWNMESRPHWFRESTEIYDRRNRAFQDMLILLDKSIAAFRSGENLLPADQIRMDIKEHSGQYFQFWLTCGPFTLNSPEDSARDFLVTMGGESAARPYPGMEFTDNFGNVFGWHKYDSPYRHVADMNYAYPTTELSIAYAYCSLDSPVENIYKVLLDCPNGISLYCNGNLIFENTGETSQLTAEQEISLPLIEGRNHILIKVEKVNSDWKFSFRLEGAEIRNHKQKYFIIPG